MIEAKHIKKSFGDIIALKDASFIFERGKTNLIIGKSGSGKTVFMKCLVGLFEPDSGEVLYDNRNFTSMNFSQRKDISKEVGMLFQGAALFDSLSVEENVMFPLDMYTNSSYTEKRKRVDFCLDRVNLDKSNKLMPSELSGGMKKRVAIARAISMNPKYLFCDEPNSGLDPQTSIVIDQLIAEITKEYDITTIVNTHDMNSVIEIGDTVSFIHKGDLWWSGDKKSVLKTEIKELKDFVFATKLMKKLEE